jgi:predicted flap endonuclease-1-like 5' DNA nuclease
MRKTLPWLLSLGLMVWAGAARASHYAVADIPRLITPAQVEKLHKGKVETTEELLNKGATGKDRKALAKATGLPGPELLVLVHRCDLLRIKGVGSEMVLLFEAAGVKSTADLATKEPAALTAAMDAANKAAKISEKPPTEPQLADWIGQAKKLPQLVENK